MEFFADIPNKNVSPEGLFELCTIERLPEFSASIEKVLSQPAENTGEIYSIWGQFTVSREAIRNGVRFALLNCPHAFAWTVAAHAEPQTIMVHCTIDKQHEDNEFIESIENFVAEFTRGLLAKMDSLP